VTSLVQPPCHHRARRFVLTIATLTALLLPALIVLSAMTHQAGLGVATGVASIALYPAGYAAARYHDAARRPAPCGAAAACPLRPQP
jgi:hypothetical protein